MTEETQIRASAIGRCRQAYALNEIPWDGTIASKVQRLTTEKIHELASYWERRATDGPREVWPGDEDAPAAAVPDVITIREAKRIIDRATGNGGLNRPARHGQRAFTRGQMAYHGRGGPIQD